MDTVVLENVTKTFRVGVGRARVREMIPPPFDTGISSLFPRWWTKNTFNALEDVSISVPEGSSLGIVGHNGAGKTTLLKILSGIIVPSRGSATVRGRIGTLIDITVGFHPDLTGRENVYMLGALYGFGRKSMSARIDQILDFADINEYVDTPMKRYSTGMVARLGFGIITSLDADVLLVDEILAVSDAGFQQKCGRWFQEYRNEGRTLLFVSHNLALIRTMTQRTIWLDHGKLMADGSTVDVLSKYGRAMEYRDTAAVGKGARLKVKGVRARGMNRWGVGGANIQQVHIDEPDHHGAPYRVDIRYSNDGLDRASFSLGLIDESGQEIGGVISEVVDLNPEGGEVSCVIRSLPLRTGIYFPVAAILSDGGVVRDQWRLDRALVIDKDGNRPYEGILGPVVMEGKWSK